MEQTPESNYEQPPEKTQLERLKSAEGLAPSEMFEPDVTEVIDEFMEYASEAFGGYKGSPLSDEQRNVPANERPRHFDAFPNSERFTFSEGYAGRGYIIGKYGNPKVSKEDDSILVLCEDGRLRTTTVEEAKHAIEEHSPHKETRRKRLGAFIGKLATGRNEQESDPESEHLYLGTLHTDEHSSEHHALKLVQPSDQHKGTEPLTQKVALTKVLTRAIGRNFSYPKLVEGEKRDLDGNPLTPGMLAAIHARNKEIEELYAAQHGGGRRGQRRMPPQMEAAETHGPEDAAIIHEQEKQFLLQLDAVVEQEIRERSKAWGSIDKSEFKKRSQNVREELYRNAFKAPDMTSEQASEIFKSIKDIRSKK